MTRKNLLGLAGVAGVLLVAGIWLNAQRARSQADIGGGQVFDDLKGALGDLEEIRLSKGDGSRTTLKRGDSGWIVVERNYPADATRVREFALAVAGMKVIENKTREPASYPKLGVEPADSPTATGTLVDLTAGKKTWSLLVGKSAEGRGVYIRKPKEAASALAEPMVVADPDQKRWLDRLVAELPGAAVHEIAVRPAAGPAYLLTRARQGDADLVLSPLPKGRKPASSMSLNGQGEALTGFNFDDVHPAGDAATAAGDHATWRTFDGQVLEFAGRRAGEKALISVTAHRDPALAAQFMPPPTSPKAQPGAVEHVMTHASGVEYEIPVYKYETLFKPLEALLEQPPQPAPKPGKK
jgi:hypothetical protein